MKNGIIFLFLISSIGCFSQKQKRKIDTTYAYQTTQLQKIEVLETQTLQTDKFYINSTSNALIKGGKNRVVLPVHLPENTQEWYYRFTASRNEVEVQNTLNTFDLAGELTTYIKTKNPLQKAVNNLTTPPGANICDVYVFNEANAKLFKEKEVFDYVLSASRENYKSGVVAVKEKINTLLFIGLRNTDNLHGIHVAIEIVAVVKTTQQIEETIRIPVYTSYLE